jgi:hypothetical protein
MKKILILITIVSLAFTSCKNEPKPEEVALQAQIEEYDALMTQAMEVHDDIMPKMSQLMELAGQLNEEMQSGKLANYTPEKIEGVVRSLKKADKDMMSWMASYSEKFPYGEPSPETKEALDKKMPVLEKEVNEIVALKERTIIAIQNAEELLKK